MRINDLRFKQNKAYLCVFLFLQQKSKKGNTVPRKGTKVKKSNICGKYFYKSLS